MSNRLLPRSTLGRSRFRRAPSCRLLLFRSAVTPQALPQRLHQVDDVRLLWLLRPLDRLARLLLLDQGLERVLVLVVELLGVEVPGLGFDDVAGQVEHVLRNLL